MLDKKNQIKMDLIMFNMSSYGEWQKGVNNRNYQLLNNFLENGAIDRILAVDYLPFTIKRAIRNFKENILENIAGGTVIKRGLFSKLTKINDKLYVYSTVKSIVSTNLVIAELKKILKKLKFNDLINWSCFPLWIGNYHAFQEKITIFDAIDNWAEHSSYQKFKYKILNNYKILAKHVDLIFTVSEEVQKVFGDRQKIIWLPNGVDFSHYQKNYNLINRDIGDLNKPIIGYEGVIQDKLDLQLIRSIAQNHKQASIVLIGPVWYDEIFKELADLRNVHFLGYKNYQELPMYIQEFDVAIIPHKNDKFCLSTNPMKLYEYLACGKPVVTVHQKELESFQPYIYLAKNYDEFNKFIDQALAEKNPVLAEKRKDLVKEQTWRKRTKIIIDYLNRELGQ